MSENDGQYAQGVLSVVPTKPPTVPAARLFTSSPCFVWAMRQRDLAMAPGHMMDDGM